MKKIYRLILVSTLLVFLFSNGFAVADQPQAKKLQVFILAGQSNMVGHANYITIPRLFADERPEVQGLASLVFKENRKVTRATIDELIAVRIKRDQVNNDLRKKVIQGDEAIAAAKADVKQLQAKYDRMLASIKENFAVSKQVYVSSIADRNRKSGPLTIGFGANAEKIGPELGFGMSMAKKVDAPILLIKTSWGGKSLHYNFRPPSAGTYQLSEKESAAENADAIRKNAGLNYRLMTEKVKEVLGNLKQYHPLYDESAGYELAGFVWFQGFNDQFSDPFRDNYEQNMITFIKDVRKQFEAPKMPFVIGVLGTGITKEKVAENAVSVAQRKAAKFPEFKGNVASVESYQVYDLSALKVFQKGWQKHFAEWCAVGSDRPYHYLGSGKFFVRFGDALAESMAELIKQQ